jgi:hypothetical protein
VTTTRGFRIWCPMTSRVTAGAVGRALLVVLSFALLIACNDDNGTHPARDLGKDLAALDSGAVLDAMPVADSTSCGSLDRPTFEGLAFVEVANSSETPQLFCDPSAGRCSWISDGCPTRRFPVQFNLNCWCTEPNCAHDDTAAREFLTFYGRRPWTRSRAAVLSLSTHDGPPPSMPTFSCSGIPSASKYNPCDQPPHHEVRQAGTTTFLYSSTASGFGTGWMLAIEADEAFGKARACRIARPDVMTCGHIEPVCATTGTVELVRSANTLYVRAFTLSFPDGAQIDGI